MSHGSFRVLNFCKSCNGSESPQERSHDSLALHQYPHYTKLNRKLSTRCRSTSRTNHRFTTARSYSPQRTQHMPLSVNSVAGFSQCMQVIGYFREPIKTQWRQWCPRLTTLSCRSFFHKPLLPRIPLHRLQKLLCPYIFLLLTTTVAHLSSEAHRSFPTYIIPMSRHFSRFVNTSSLSLFPLNILVKANTTKHIHRANSQTIRYFISLRY